MCIIILTCYNACVLLCIFVVMQMCYTACAVMHTYCNYNACVLQCPRCNKCVSQCIHVVPNAYMYCNACNVYLYCNALLYCNVHIVKHICIALLLLLYFYCCTSIVVLLLLYFYCCTSIVILLDIYSLANRCPFSRIARNQRRCLSIKYSSGHIRCCLFTKFIRYKHHVKIRTKILFYFQRTTQSNDSSTQHAHFINHNSLTPVVYVVLYTYMLFNSGMYFYNETFHLHITLGKQINNFSNRWHTVYLLFCLHYKFIFASSIRYHRIK